METHNTAPQTPAERAGTVKLETRQAAGDLAASVGEEAKEVTQEAKDQVRALWGQTQTELADQAATQQTRAAAGLRELADQLTSMAGSADGNGMARGLVDDVARRAGDAASWLDHRDPGAVLEEARRFARQRPGAFLMVAAGVGLLAGRLSRSLVDEARDSDGPQIPEGARPAPSGSRESTDSGAPAPGHDGDGWGVTRTNGNSSGILPAPVPDLPGGSPRVPPGFESAAPGSEDAPPSDVPVPAHRTSQPLAPDGSFRVIDDEGLLTAEDTAPLRDDR